MYFVFVLGLLIYTALSLHMMDFKVYVFVQGSVQSDCYVVMECIYCAVNKYGIKTKGEQ